MPAAPDLLAARWRARAAGRWQPQPKQKTATDLAGQVDELLYGGARGGGKTYWLIQYLADFCENHAGIRVLVLRREFPSLQETVIPRCEELLERTGRAKKRAGNPTTFTFPNGSVLVCRSLVDQRKAASMRGTEYAIVAFEELTEFSQGQYEELRGTVRTSIKGVRPHTVATTNPGGTGHRWVKRRFVKPRPDDLPDGEERPTPGKPWRPRATLANPRPEMRCFLPATLADNPALMDADPEYKARLSAISDAGLRKAMVDGDWDAIDAPKGALWKQKDLDEHRVSKIWVPVARRVVAVDPSDGDEDNDAYGVAVVARGADGVAYVEQVMEWYGSPAELASMTAALFWQVAADVVVIERNHGGKWVPAMLLKTDKTINVKAVWASEGKRTRAEPVASLFEAQPLRQPQVLARMVGEHEEAEAELTMFTGSGPSPNMLDAIVWGVHFLAIGPREMRDAGKIADRRLASR